MADGDATQLDAATFASFVDHTLLKPEATRAQIVDLCAEAVELRTAAVCTNGLWVPTVAAELAGSDVAVCSVVGFPLGAMSNTSVAAETRDAVDSGAVEIDMVIAVGHLRAHDDRAAAEAVAAVRAAAPDATLKVILETAILSDDEIVRACRLSVGAGADFVKTSTGFNTAGGATEAAVRLMRDTVGPDIGVKASGGIRSLADVEAMLAAGASRLGMSATAQVIAELEDRH
jgi:deoxyribose-phosphate aldolase